MEWIDIREAAKISGRSVSTLKRALKKDGWLVTGQNNSLTSQNQNLTSQMTGRILYKKTPTNNGFHWYFEKNSLIFYYDLTSQKTNFDQSNVGFDQSNDQSKLAPKDMVGERIGELKDVISYLKKQIETKDEQLKNEQERNKELQYLLACAHKKIEFLEAPINQHELEKPKKGLILRLFELPLKILGG